MPYPAPQTAATGTDPDVKGQTDELLHVLIERCVELIDVDAAGVMLAMQPGKLRAVAREVLDGVADVP